MGYSEELLAAGASEAVVAKSREVEACKDEYQSAIADAATVPLLLRGEHVNRRIDVAQKRYYAAMSELEALVTK